MNTYTPRTDANGAYSVHVTNGNSQVYAFVSVNYLNATWSLQLSPKDNSNDALDSSNGINKDFQWVLHGQMPGNNGTTYDDYYGAAITVNLSVLSTIPAGSTFTFTLTPNGSLIDGSTGQAITLQQTQQDLSINQGSVSLDHTNFLYDIPIGDYTISGQLTGSDGTTQTVLFDGSQSEEISWANLSQPNVHIVGLQQVNISVGGS